jgi:hypothetical protein
MNSDQKYPPNSDLKYPPIKNLKPVDRRADTIIGIVAGVIPLILFIVLGLVYFFKYRNASRNIKYLTSSTSPGFDLTYTPNL